MNGERYDSIHTNFSTAIFSSFNKYAHVPNAWSIHTLTRRWVVHSQCKISDRAG